MICPTKKKGIFLPEVLPLRFETSVKTTLMPLPSRFRKQGEKVLRSPENTGHPFIKEKVIQRLESESQKEELKAVKKTLRK